MSSCVIAVGIALFSITKRTYIKGSFVEGKNVCAEYNLTVNNTYGDYAVLDCHTILRFNVTNAKPCDVRFNISDDNIFTRGSVYKMYRIKITEDEPSDICKLGTQINKLPMLPMHIAISILLSVWGLVVYLTPKFFFDEERKNSLEQVELVELVRTNQPNIAIIQLANFTQNDHTLVSEDCVKIIDTDNGVIPDLEAQMINLNYAQIL